MRISTVLDQVELGTMTLPEFQRGYVWNRGQVRGLVQSLYRDYPIGGLLVWTTEADSSLRRDAMMSGGVVKLLLDGQQRITSLYGVVKGEPPAFFQGNADAFRDLHFDVRTETFEFYGPVKMKGDPHWVNVTELFKLGVEPVINRLVDHLPDVATSLKYQTRLNRILAIGSRELHIEEITGREKTIDEVVEIFNRVNSGGTKLSKGDLALARISADRPASRNELRAAISAWDDAGYHFELDWLLRVVNAIVTGQAAFTALRDVDPPDFAEGIQQANKAVNFLLNLVSDRLGLDHDRVLAGRYAFPIMARVVVENGGSITDTSVQNQLMYWYVHSFMWGRYSGSTETTLQRDLEAYSSEGIDGLVAQIRRMRGTLDVRPDDFDSWSVGSRFYPVLYMLSRVRGARDLGTGMELKASLLGRESALHVHHVFPKSRLYKAGYDRPAANALANFSFLTASSNLSVGDSLPSAYFPRLEAANPGVLESQWIPRDPSLWTIEQYPAFAEARRRLMADAINSLLASLVSGEQPVAQPVSADVVTRSVDYEEDPEIERVLALVKQLSLSEPEVHFEISDEDSGEVQAMADLAWPEGVQEGLSESVAFLLEPDQEMEERLSALGYRFFVSIESLTWYLEQLTGEDIDGDGVLGDPDGHGSGSSSPARPSAETQPHETATEPSEVIHQEAELRFHQAMADIYRRARSETGYTPTRFAQMLGDVGGLETARRLISAPEVSDGFTTLWEKGRLDLTVEAHVIKPEYADLFTDWERQTARARLEEYGYQL